MVALLICVVAVATYLRAAGHPFGELSGWRCDKTGNAAICERKPAPPKSN